MVVRVVWPITELDLMGKHQPWGKTSARLRRLLMNLSALTPRMPVEGIETEPMFMDGANQPFAYNHLMGEWEITVFQKSHSAYWHNKGEGLYAQVVYLGEGYEDRNEVQEDMPILIKTLTMELERRMASA